MRRHLTLAVALSAFALVACGKKTANKTAAKTPPPPAKVASAASKPPPATKPATTTKKTEPPADAGPGTEATPACTAADVGKCGCLGADSLQDDSGVIYDMVCCDAVGNDITLYSCGDTAVCDDSGSAVACVDVQ